MWENRWQDYRCSVGQPGDTGSSDPPHTKLANVTKVCSERLGLEEGVSTLRVSVDDMLFEKNSCLNR